jgi:hypothetical protein
MEAHKGYDTDRPVHELQRMLSGNGSGPNVVGARAIVADLLSGDVLAETSGDTFATDLNGERYVCTCDDVSACSGCFDAARLYVGKVIEDGHGRIWEVEDTDVKDDWPTLDGATYWGRPDDATVLAPSVEAAADLARCDDCGKVSPLAELKTPERLGERLDPGGMVPAGECPHCGALAYPVSALIGSRG